MVSSTEQGRRRIAQGAVVAGFVLQAAAVAFTVLRPGVSTIEPLPVTSAAAAVATLPGQEQAARDAASIAVEQGVVRFYFASGKAALPAGAAQALAGVVRAGQGGRTLVVSGFHDASGKPASNAALAKQRAVAVQTALVAAGVPPGRIKVRKPVQLDESSSDAQARRVDIRTE